MPAVITLLNPSHRRGIKRKTRTTARRRRGNPGYLILVNGKKRRPAMAVRRRRRTTRRRVTTNPRRRRRTTAAAPRRRRRAPARRTNRKRRGGILSFMNPRRRRRRANPVRRRRRTNPVRRRRSVRSRSNPALKGIIESSIAAVAGMAITDFAQGLVPFAFGGALGKIAVRLGLAYALGVAAEKFPMTRKYANMLAVGGAVGAAQDAIRLFMGGGLTATPQVGAGGVPGRVAMPAQFTGDDQGMSDIVGVPANWGGLGEIVGTNFPPSYFQ